MRFLGAAVILLAGLLVMTWNPSDKGAAVVLTNGNKDAAGSGSVFNSVRGKLAKEEGYFEVELKTLSSMASVVIGVGDASFSLSSYPGATAKSAGVQWVSTPTTQPFVSGVTRANGFVNIPTSSPGDVIMVYLKDGNAWFGRNGVWTSGDPSLGTAPNVTGFTGLVYPAVGTYDAANKVSIRTLASEFSYPIPDGGTEWGEGETPNPNDPTLPPVWEKVTDLYINSGPPRQYVGPVFMTNCWSVNGVCTGSRGPIPGVWTPIDLTVSPWNLASDAKWAWLSGRVIITRGAASESAHVGVMFRAPGDTRVICDQSHYMGQGVEASAAGGIRTNMSTWVPLVNGKVEVCWEYSTPGTWPTNSSYGINLSIQAWAR